MSETLNGLHVCQPKNEPQVGQVKTFQVIHNPAKGDKKAWIKIKSASEDKGGTPFRIVSVTPTGWEPDAHGNTSFNLEIESQNGSATPQAAPQRAFTGNGQDDRSSRIERQHSQSAAIAYFALAGKVPTTRELRDMTSWLQRDIGTDPLAKSHDDPPVPKDEPQEEEIDF